MTIIIDLIQIRSYSFESVRTVARASNTLNINFVHGARNYWKLFEIIQRLSGRKIRQRETESEIRLVLFNACSLNRYPRFGHYIRTAESEG